MAEERWNRADLIGTLFICNSRRRISEEKYSSTVDRWRLPSALEGAVVNVYETAASDNLSSTEMLLLSIIWLVRDDNLHSNCDVVEHIHSPVLMKRDGR
jgi:hypothetical protein